jgi:ketosteroid isomerase-like protein
MQSRHDPEIDVFIEKVVDYGSHYQIDRMEALYTPDQSILFVSGEGRVDRVPRADMLAEFAARGRSGDRPLSTEHRVLHVEQQGDHATALLYRRMSPSAPPALYELRLRKDDRGWRVAGETVLAFPRPGDADDFLPKRQHRN